MIACAECGELFYPGALFCEACGAAVHPAARTHVAGQQALGPRRGRAATPEQPTRREAERAGRSGSAAQGVVRAYVPHAAAEITLRGSRIRVGRADPESGYKPELDLTPYQGFERGVSRRHATIERVEGGFVLVDQHSSNGTWLNGMRLVPGYAYQIPPEAEARFGDLLVQLSPAD